MTQNGKVYMKWNLTNKINYSKEATAKNKQTNKQYQKSKPKKQPTAPPPNNQIKKREPPVNQ